MRTRKMTLEVIIIVIVTIAGILAALAIRFAYSIHDWAELAEELQSENDALREDTGELCKEKLSLISENEHLKNQLDDALAAYENSEKERIRMVTDAKTQQEEPEIAANEVLQANAESSKERLPEGRTNVISGMPYTTITNKRSEQWALQLQAFTGKYGIRSYFDGDHIYFLVAMGSAYGREIGNAFRVTLKCGTEFYVMLAEYKDDGSDPNFFGHKTKNYIGDDVICILEFIYDPENIDKRVKGDNGSGTFTVFDEFGGLWGYGGDIVEIEYLGRKWKP